MQHTIYIADELVLEAHPDGPYILLRREGQPGAVRVYLNEVRYLARTGNHSRASMRYRYSRGDALLIASSTLLLQVA